MRFIKSLYKSFKRAFSTNEEVRKLKNKYPRLVNFFVSRFDRTKFSGLPLTILGVAFFYILLLLFGAVKGFVTSNFIVSLDVRVNTLVYVFRNLTAVKFFLWVSALGKSLTVIFFVFVASSILWLERKKWEIVTLLITLAGTTVFVYVAKLVFDRPRPALAVYLENTNSFPSGHAAIAVALYGFFAYLLLRDIKKKKYRVLTILFAILFISTIGFSRIYLGVHYVSDVWTGYLLGFFWLLIGISLNELKIFQHKNQQNDKKIKLKHTKKLELGLIGAVVVFYAVYGYFYRPELIFKAQTTVQSTVVAVNGIFVDYNLPRNTETLTGKTQEPVSFIITAKEDAALIKNFKQAGWSLADTVNFHSTAAIFKYAVENKNYPTAPMTPSFWNKQVNDFGFEKSTEANTVRERHHARFWKTELKTEKGENIYVGTASLDVAIKWLITHKISPDIDTERELLFSDMQKAGAIKNFEKVKSVNPVLGQNFSGDLFFTDGEAYFIDFNN